MLPFVMLPRPLQESNVIGKGGTAGFLGAAYDPYYMFQDPAAKFSTDDLTLRGRKSTRAAWNAGPRCCRRSTRQMPEIEKAVSRIRPGRPTTRRPWSWSSPAGPARRSTSNEEKDETPRPVRPAHLRPVAAAGPPADRSRHARRAGELAGRRQRQPDGRRLGHARRQLRPAEEPALPQARQRPAGADRRPGRARACSRTRSCWPSASSAAAPRWASAPAATPTAPTAATTGRTATPA